MAGNNWSRKLELDSSALPNWLGLPQISAPAENLTEEIYNREQIEELARTSLDFLAALAMPTVFRYLFPPVFLSIWQWLLSYIHRARDFSQLAIGLPRGFGKTMLIKIFILYCIIFT